MTAGSLDAKTRRIGTGTYVYPSADHFGDVTIGEGCWIGPGARIRGNYGTIVIRDYRSVEDDCVTHVRPDEQTTIGNKEAYVDLARRYPEGYRVERPA